MFKGLFDKLAASAATSFFSAYGGKLLLAALCLALLFGGVQSARLTLTQKDLTYTQEELAGARSQIAGLKAQMAQQADKTIPALQALVRGAYDSAKKAQNNAARRAEIMAEALPVIGQQQSALVGGKADAGASPAPVVVDAETSRLAAQHLNHAFGFGGLRGAAPAANSSAAGVRVPAPEPPGL